MKAITRRAFLALAFMAVAAATEEDEDDGERRGRQ